MNVVCAFCNNTSETLEYPMDESSSYMCDSCMKEFIREVVFENWQFEPNVAGRRHRYRNPAYDMSNQDMEDAEGELPRYEPDEDDSTKKTKELKDKYDKKNRDMGMRSGAINFNLGT